MHTTVRARSLSGYFQLTRHLGFNPRDVLRNAGLDAGILDDPERRVPLSVASLLLEETARNATCPAFGLRLAELRQDFDFGALGLLCAHKRTLRDALLALIQYRNLLSDSMTLHLETVGDTVLLHAEFFARQDVALRQATELTIGLLARTCNALLGAEWRPTHVSFVHSPPLDAREHRRFFRCPVTFDSEFNGIAFLAADLDRPNPNADIDLVRYAETLVKPQGRSRADSIVSTVRQVIHLMLPLDQADVEQVAHYLNLSSRTLRRQLGTAGTSFSDLVDEVRASLAMRHLKNVQCPIGGVAAQLGYSRQASFTRWFNAHFGMTPREWRATYLKDRDTSTSQ